MKQRFKKKVLKLYKGFDSVLGPYSRKDGRKHIVLNCSTKHYKTRGKLKTISWPKIKMEVKLKRLLTKNEQVDHIDEDLSNNKYSNFQILTSGENTRKSVKLTGRSAKNKKLVCVMCGCTFSRDVSRYRFDMKTRPAKYGWMCSQTCKSMFFSIMLNVGIIKK